MIEGNFIVRADNNLGEFRYGFKTAEHPTPYGNGTMLMSMVISSPIARFGKEESYDLRYSRLDGVEDIIEIIELIMQDKHGENASIEIIDF